MLRNFILLMLLFTGILANAQEIRTNEKNEFLFEKYANDIIINSDPTIDQRSVKLAVAYNGWLFAAFNTVNVSTNSGGITIMASTDNGATWSQVDSYSVPNVRYPAFDIVVAGTDLSDLKLYLVGVNNNISSNTYILFVDKYNAATFTFIESPYNENKGTRKIYDVSMATDYRFPAVEASPYSVGFAYSIYSSSRDSINFIGSTDGGTVWNVKQNIATTGSYYRKVSLAYGRSVSASNGRYFAAWEQLFSSTARTGHIYTSRNQSTISGLWIDPQNLDSISSTMINLCRNPSIAVQFNNIDNDSSSVTAVVLVDRDYTGNGSDYDMLGFYNKRAHYTNFWYRLDIVNSGENDMFSDITYDPGVNNFLAVYYDSTNNKLPYVINDMNLTVPSTWTTINGQYNDESNLSMPYPRVEINPVNNQAAQVWTANGTGTNGIAMFDAEYSNVGVKEVTQNVENVSVYPNPVVNNLNINIQSKISDHIIIKMFDITGKIVYTQNSIVKEGSNLVNINTTAIAAGSYILNIKGATINKNLKIIK